MKKALYYLSILLLVSCTAIKQFSNEEIKQKKACSSITFHGKAAIIDTEIDRVNTKFILDTGSGLTVLLDSTIVPNFNNKKFGYLGSAKNAKREKIKNRFLTATLKTELFESESKVLTFINKPVSKCIKSKNIYTGILGLDVFFDEKQSMQLNFSNNKVCNIDENQLNNLLNDSNYYLIKSECKNSQIFIFLTMEEKEYKLKLDTGYLGNIIIPFTDDLDIKNNNKIELEGTVYTTVSGNTKGKEVYYEKMPVSFGNKTIFSKVSVSTTIKAQNIGIEFIKGFDWIVDYNNNKVYVKGNNNIIDFQFSRKVTYYAKANSENKLIVSVKEISQTKYKLGDEIFALNNQKITPENICEMQELLNNTEDWDSLNIEIKK